MKRIILCADGTWNSRDQIGDGGKVRRPTNVTKIARSIRPRDDHGIDQVVFYHDGVGTSGGLDKLTGGAFGNGVEANIRALYRFVLYNYVPGDEIFLLGFSRGAFTVRSLIGFMNMVGLIEKRDDYFIPEIYAIYEKGARPTPEQMRQAVPRMEGTVSPCPPIKFVGVWDTVGALGAPGFLGQAFNRDKYRYHDVELNANIQHAFHALAIDERRKPFAPSIWTRGAFAGTLEQVWFAGVHSNVGGSCTPDGLANEALHWMVAKATACGLAVDPLYLAPFKPCFNSPMQDSFTTMYKIKGPFVRPIGERLADGEMVHQAVLDRVALKSCGYAPANLEKAKNAAARPPVCNTPGVKRGVPC